MKTFPVPAFLVRSRANLTSLHAPHHHQHFYASYNLAGTSTTSTSASRRVNNNTIGNLPIHRRRRQTALARPLIDPVVSNLITDRAPDPVVPLDRLDPPLPPRPDLGIRPLPIKLQHPREADDPGREDDVDERDGGPEEEGAGDVGGVDEVGDGGL